MAVSKAQIRKIARACESVWDQIGQDVPEILVPAVEMVEIAMDAGRLITYGKGEANDLWLQLKAECHNNVQAAYQKVAEQCQFSDYEAGGATL